MTTHCNDADGLRVFVSEAVALKPGDNVLITFNDGSDPTEEHLLQVRDMLKERFPGVEFAFGTGFRVHKVEGGS